VQMLMQQVQQAQQAGQQVPPQILAQGEQAQEIISQPSQEEVMALLQDDISRNYRIDVESDSTIRNDLSRNQQTMNMFLQGTAQFGQAMGPIIMADASMKPVVMEIYGAFARQFKLGRQAEDAIEAATEQAQKTKDQPPPPDPKVEAEKAKAEHEKAMFALEAQGKQAEIDGKLKLMQAQIQMKERELQLKEQELALKEREMVINSQMKQREAAIKAEGMEHKAEIEERSMTNEAIMNERTAALQAEGIEHKHELGMEAAEHKAKMAKQKPKAAAR
jgi:hypothetical protein